MDPWTWSAGKGVWLAVLFDVTLAHSVYSQRRLGTDSDDIWDELTLSTGAKVGAILFAIVVVATVMLVCWCACARRTRGQEAREPLLPPPMAPGMLGPAVRGYAQQPVPCAMTSPVAPYPQQYYYQQQAPPYPQEGLYVGHNMAPYAEPPTMPMQPPSAPMLPPPPPPYRYPPQYAQ
ncbi:protein shisa-5-like [Dermacentor silvarum]|uniref:protein shisa-5-like n=1 Tax=Dermacentor silvarum TaxID=543639 RepID=UPI00189A3FB8|nr:protein shisa-5-like [Dermacentor silvarum]XP_049514156.1 protein shisa-5-like [Dermacentor silvarum]XP_049514157.1 protein shisa-5-like [Dermacentor silvarum]XP_049514158.1 protein shisa-5-like [Dermacentor silvarum]